MGLVITLPRAGDPTHRALANRRAIHCIARTALRPFSVAVTGLILAAHAEGGLVNDGAMPAAVGSERRLANTENVPLVVAAVAGAIFGTTFLFCVFLIIFRKLKAPPSSEDEPYEPCTEEDAPQVFTQKKVSTEDTSDRMTPSTISQTPVRGSEGGEAVRSEQFTAWTEEELKAVGAVGACEQVEIETEKVETKNSETENKASMEKDVGLPKAAEQLDTEKVASMDASKPKAALGADLANALTYVTSDDKVPSIVKATEVNPQLHVVKTSEALESAIGPGGRVFCCVSCPCTSVNDPVVQLK